ncbi:MAG TPA: response regulator transcription factor [Propionibacteriaceae bacterium]|nr:response regulator transcription factor [Propionibacteriaceae bacterium]
MTEGCVLIVDDDPSLRELYATTLAQAGYSVVEAADGQRAIEVARSGAPDLVLLDVGLGSRSIDGLEVCRRLRKESCVPIMLLTSRSEEADQLLGLFAGADDYLVKPVSLRLLPAKVATLLRRTAAVGGGSAMPATLASDDLVIDLDGRTVSVAGTAVALTKIQFDLLAALAENPGRVLTREQLVERVWGDWFGDDHHLDVHLSRLRAKITGAGGPRVAHALRGVGFRLRS